MRSAIKNHLKAFDLRAACLESQYGGRRILKTNRFRHNLYFNHVQEVTCAIRGLCNAGVAARMVKIIHISCLSSTQF